MKFINKEKIEKIKLNKDNFYVAIDFDGTITARKSCDSWDATGKMLGKEFQNKLDSLAKKYGPIELDYKISFEEKRKAMEEWYNIAMQLFYEYNLTQEQLKQSINMSNLIFREGAKEFLIEMNKNNIPVIILSAGIGNVIKQFLQSNNCYFDNMNIISNFFHFDKAGKIKKQQGTIIHTLNKTMKGNITTEIAEIIKNKEFRLLFGDFVEDKKIVPAEEWDKTISIRIFRQKC